jgi:hypothetical protein
MVSLKNDSRKAIREVVILYTTRALRQKRE